MHTASVYVTVCVYTQFDDVIVWLYHVECLEYVVSSGRQSQNTSLSKLSVYCQGSLSQLSVYCSDDPPSELRVIESNAPQAGRWTG